MKKILFAIPVVILLGFTSYPSEETANPSASREKKQRRDMVMNQIMRRGVSNKRVIDAMAKIPRHRFVDKSQRERAYNDHPLPIGEGQTISQPYIVALMTEKLKLKPSDRVLEIGTGSGYQAAVLAEIVQEVYSIEIRENLVKRADSLLKSLGYINIRTKYGDGYFGWKEHAPFDAIIVTAAANHIAPPLIRQLKDGGRLIIPLGSTRYHQTLTLVTKKGEDLDVQQMGGVVFVPMVGEVQKKK
ncbi:MAG: protein-L-isoaspartate(D-aspartate) O-methyltransferase [Nitrospiraceae bacterium]|nr:MAG: protein-L-isoaspartate(D-aspartate) O-methyltransferase [Nitrospiraceae bacterium]